MPTIKDETKITVKFLVGKQKKKVIYAEANNDFFDTLFSFLTLPMGTIVRLLRDEKSDISHPSSLGSMSSLYQGLENLDPKYFCTDEYGKNMLLKSRNSSANECSKLKVNIDDTGPLRYFVCEDLKCASSKSTSLFSPHNVATCVCGKQMNKELVPRGLRINGCESCDGVFFTPITTFILSDDLCVMENLPTSSLDLLNESGIKDMGDLEEKTLSFGSKEFIHLLKCLLCSKTPLTDFFSGKLKQVNSEQVNLIFAGIGRIETASDNLKKLNLKLMVQKSTKKILYGVAGEDFVDFIFSFLAIPLGRVVALLNGNSCLGSVDNLYKSISKPFVCRQLKSSELKNKLISPCLASLYMCKNCIFSLSEEETTNQLYSGINSYIGDAFLIASEGNRYYSTNGGYYLMTCSSLNLKDPKFYKGFLRGPYFFMVTEDLVVTHLSSSMYALSVLNRMKIPFADVEEQVVSIGNAEALSILKASLHSKSTLTNGIMPFLKNIKDEP